MNGIYEPKLHDMMKEQFEFNLSVRKKQYEKAEIYSYRAEKRAYEIGLDGGEEEREEEGELLQEEPEVVPMIPQFCRKMRFWPELQEVRLITGIMELLDMKGMPEFTEDTAGEKKTGRNILWTGWMIR